MSDEQTRRFRCGLGRLARSGRPVRIGASSPNTFGHPTTSRVGERTVHHRGERLRVPRGEHTERRSRGGEDSRRPHERSLG